MSDIFEAGAGRTLRKRAKETGGQEITLENNALVRVIEQQRKVRAEEEAEREQRRAEYRAAKDKRNAEDLKELMFYLETAKKLLAVLGRPVESFYMEPGGETLSAHRKTETVRVHVGKIDSIELKRIAVRRVIESIIG